MARIKFKQNRYQAPRVVETPEQIQARRLAHIEEMTPGSAWAEYHNSRGAWAGRHVSVNLTDEARRNRLIEFAALRRRMRPLYNEAPYSQYVAR